MWLKHHLEVFHKLTEANQHGEHKPIRVYEGPNPRSASKEYSIDGATRAKVLLDRAIKDFGIDTSVLDPKKCTFPAKCPSALLSIELLATVYHFVAFVLRI
jgi:hypothetical protein